jgi:hypothetical protein
MDDAKPQALDGKEEGLLRAQIAKLITLYAFIFIAVVALFTLIAAGVVSYHAAAGDDQRVFFFEVAKYILATVLPVVAGWVGTVLAFYYGKANFEAGTKSVATAANVLTSKDKLAATTVAGLGKARKDFKALILTAEENANDKAVKLDRVDKEFQPASQQDKPYERLPILRPGDLPYMVLHRSTLNSFLVDEWKKDPQKTIDQFNLGQLYDHVDYLPVKSFVTVAPTDTAAQAKSTMEDVQNCADVFVTADGTPGTAVARWITNADLLDAAEV